MYNISLSEFEFKRIPALILLILLNCEGPKDLLAAFFTFLFFITRQNESSKTGAKMHPK